MGHYLFRRALVTWLVSLVANAWSFSVLYSSFLGRVGGELPFVVAFAALWTIIAFVASALCLALEGRKQEPKQEVIVRSNANANEFRRLLDEHRKNNA
jgi:hypothetical protein